ncbi:keratin, type I cytoskeletal 20 [Sarcophilus harrisii]|uniref:Keratin, type I cytoskeletal 20 n=1 Tax=Sarcophilus harrisii TaxID=9305 RepID=G3VZ13_SARHA|nr:keratin, type I cytoskeletal 20 [Sarcophilus harrisii]
MDFTRKSFHRSNSFTNQPSFVMSGVAFRKGFIQGFSSPSVYGGAGGQGTRISSTSQVATYERNLSEDFSVGNEKITMQNLNDRLASYLERVRSLEQTNSQLETQIREWHKKSSPILTRDYSSYFKTIEDLRKQIKDAQQANAFCILQLDNSKLASDDFRMKYETELRMKLAVEADVKGLHKVFDNLTLQKSDLETQIENLNEELLFLKKSHQEEITNLKGQLGNTVNVEVDAAPSHDLGTIMNEMRQKYEIMAQKNLQEAKEQFEKRIESLQQEVQVSTKEIKTGEVQVMELRRNYQTLEIELQTQYSTRASFEHALEETNARYGAQLAQIQALISSVEAQLMQVRSDMERQNEEYNALLDIKTRLEMEIATYRRLLEGEDVRSENFQLATMDEKDIKKTRKIKTVVEEVVDGKVVSSQIKEIEENI